MLTDDEYKRLIQLLGMLGSDHDGEVLNAARLARKLVLNSKSTFEEIFSPAGRGHNPGGRPGMRGEGNKFFDQKDLQEAHDRGFAAGVKSARAYKAGGWKQWAKERVAIPDEISPWELKFFSDFANGKFSRPTEKQRGIFERVAERLDLELPESRPNGSDPPF
jgi:hypothetical protein